MASAHLAFEDWLEHAFGRAVPFHGQPWYMQPGAAWWEPRPAEALAWLTRLFEDPEPALAPYADGQIAQGLVYLLGTSAVGERGWVSEPAVPLAARLRFLAAVPTLFARLFAPRCPPVLAHRDEPGAGPLSGVCYMWWDEFPTIARPEDPDRSRLEAAALAAMARILALPSDACRESALHGLGHARRWDPPRVAAIVDAFLAAAPGLRPELAAYARAARAGCVL